jgi:copper chaperone NosL
VAGIEGSTEALANPDGGMPMRVVFMIISMLFTCGAEAAISADPQDIREFPVCTYCNMNRQAYAHSRTLIKYADGTAFGACSIHCTAVNLVVQIDKTPVTILVGDYYSKTLIDAEAAWWVLGGAKPGVMTKRAKWAFLKKADAEHFISENGGNPASFDDVMKAAYQDMYNDTKMIRAKKRIKKMNPP